MLECVLGTDEAVDRENELRLIAIEIVANATIVENEPVAETIITMVMVVVKAEIGTESVTEEGDDLEKDVNLEEITF